MSINDTRPSAQCQKGVPVKAIVFENYGSPDQLSLRDVAMPVPSDDEVLVKIHAVSINDWDWGILQGASLLDRLMSGLSRPRQPILGSDIAGRVEAVGSKVSRYRPGDAVYGDLSGQWGGFAEYVCAPASKLAPKPAGMTFAEAASIPQAAMLALQGLRDIGKVRQGGKLLVNGAGGGVGTFAVQIAKLYELEVTGVDNAEKQDFMRSVGFDKVIDYTSDDFTANGVAYDYILDAKTNRSVSAYLRALAPGGRYVTVGGLISRLLQVLVGGPLVAIASKKTLRIVALKPNKDLAYMNELFEAGKLKPVLDALYPLSATPEAMRYFGAGRHKGKVVITLE
jgi:NADPH:quinone reductase-like Zn-dependent oxidoreductase